jgi:hypothetical protein
MHQLESSGDCRRFSYLFKEQTGQLLATVVDTQAVCGVDDPYQRVGLFKIVFPVGPQGFLATDVPWSGC